MKWSEEKVQKLRTLAFAGKSNKEIAQQLGVGINDVYAKRSQLGITIDKVKTAHAETARPKPEATPEPSSKVDIDGQEISEKRNLLRSLEPAIKKADSAIWRLKLTDDGNFVEICYGNGEKIRAFIEGDSLMAIIADVARKCLF